MIRSQHSHYSQVCNMLHAYMTLSANEMFCQTNLVHIVLVQQQQQQNITRNHRDRDLTMSTLIIHRLWCISLYT